MENIKRLVAMKSVNDTTLSLCNGFLEQTLPYTSTGNGACDIVALLLSVVAIGISVWAVYEAKKRENTRKLKDTIINELISFNASYIKYLNPIIEGKKKYSCQETISWFKFSMMKIEAIISFVDKSLEVKNNNITQIKTQVQDLRSVITDCTSFRKQYNEEKYVLNEQETLEVEQSYSKLYANILSSVHQINIAERIKVKQDK